MTYSLCAMTYSLCAKTYSLCADLSYSSLSAFSSYLSITLVSGTDELALTYYSLELSLVLVSEST